MIETVEPRKSLVQRLLNGIEVVGNKVPHPAVIFVLLCVVVIALSQLFHMLGTSVTFLLIDPQTHRAHEETAVVNSLLTADGIRYLFTSTVRNFMAFGPVGVILVVMVGVGIAEEAGLIRALVRQIVNIAPRYAITFIIVFLGIISSIAQDAGYLVLLPLGAAAFYSIGRHPLAGLAAAFAGVAGLFGVNLLITPTDAILTEITNDAIHLVAPTQSITLTANLWFSIASTLLMCVVCTFITDRIVEPRLGKYEGSPVADGDTSGDEPAGEARGLKFAGLALLGFSAVVALLTLPPGAPLRDPQTGAIIGDSPFMASLIVLVMLLFLVTGIAYGAGARTLGGTKDYIGAVTKTYAGLADLLFLFLIISQFIAYFNYSNMATVAAVKMGDVLEHANVGSIWLLLAFMAVVAVVSLVLASIIPKWAIFAPIFIPLFMRLHVAPDVVLAAYRVADSPANVVTPLMPYLALVVVFARRYLPDAGVGTIVALMLPYYAALYIFWTLLFVAWYFFGLSFGPSV